MHLTRFVATLLLIQGAIPALGYGVLRPGGWMYLAALLLYAYLAWGVWSARRWALQIASGLTLLQLFVIATGYFSWYFQVGPAIGIGLAPVEGSVLDWHILAYRNVASVLVVVIGENCVPLHNEFATEGPFIIVNLLAATVLALLLITLRRGAVTVLAKTEHPTSSDP